MINRVTQANEVKISLCMIVKNEELILDKSLDYINDYVDEIIIVDTGSDDLTVSVAKRYTNQIYHYCWSDDFSDARNFALNHAKYEWILMQDADEFIINVKNLKNFLLSCDKDCIAVTKKNIYIDHQDIDDTLDIEEIDTTHAYISSQEKLIRNNKGLLFKGSVHERVYYAYDKRPNIVSYNFPLIHLMDMRKINDKSMYYNKLGLKDLERGRFNVDLFVNGLLFFLENDDLDGFEKTFDKYRYIMAYESRVSFVMDKIYKHLYKLNNNQYAIDLKIWVGIQ